MKQKFCQTCTKACLETDCALLSIKEGLIWAPSSACTKRYRGLLHRNYDVTYKTERYVCIARGKLKELVHPNYTIHFPLLPLLFSIGLIHRTYCSGEDNFFTRKPFTVEFLVKSLGNSCMPSCFFFFFLVLL